MFKNTFIRLTFLSLICQFFYACGKDSGGGPLQKARITLLTQADWAIIKSEAKTDNAPYVNYFPGWAACDKDNRWVMRMDKTYEVNEGPTKCNAADPQIVKFGNWDFKNGETIVTIGPYDYAIEKIGEDSLILINAVTTGPSTFYTRNTFVH